MKSRTVSKSDSKKIDEEVSKEYGVSVVADASQVRIIEDEYDIITLDGTPAFFYVDGDIAPLLSYMLQKDVIGKKIVIDMGAVRPIASGADCMIPGILQCDSDLESGDIAVIVDENHGKPLSVVRMRMSSQEIEKAEKGRAVETLHHIGDTLWNMFTP